MNINAIPELTVSGHVTGASFGDISLFETCDDFRADERAEYSEGSLFFGKFSITVRPGTYRVLIHSAESDGDRYVWHAGAADCERATPVTIDSDGFLKLSAIVEEYDSGPSDDRSPGQDAEPSVPRARQSVNAPRKKVKVGARTKLARRTDAASRVIWKTATPKKCKVRGFRLVAKQTGTCRIFARASAVPGYSPLTKEYRVRVKGR
jgi:hypothetical protein